MLGPTPDTTLTWTTCARRVEFDSIDSGAGEFNQGVAVIANGVLHVKIPIRRWRAAIHLL
jgi:hypothetical protein